MPASLHSVLIEQLCTSSIQNSLHLLATHKKGKKIRQYLVQPMAINFYEEQQTGKGGKGQRYIIILYILYILIVVLEKVSNKLMCK